MQSLCKRVVAAISLAALCLVAYAPNAKADWDDHDHFYAHHCYRSWGCHPYYRSWRYHPWMYNNSGYYPNMPWSAYNGGYGYGGYGGYGMGSGLVGAGLAGAAALGLGSWWASRHSHW